MKSFKQTIHLFVFVVFFSASTCLAAEETRVEQSTNAANDQVKFASHEAKRHIEGALKLEKQLDLFGAIESYSKAAALAPDSAEVHFLFAEALTKAKRFQDALLRYTLAVNIAPDHTKALYGRSRLCLRIALYGQAFKDLNKLITLSPGIADYHYQRARALMKLNNIEDAYYDFLRAHELDKRYPRPTLRENNAASPKKWAELHPTRSHDTFTDKYA
jgi:tetratricopeptide (TPR) repeat protein